MKAKTESSEYVNPEFQENEEGLQTFVPKDSKPFQLKNLSKPEKRRLLSLSMSLQDDKDLKEDMATLQQPKDSTAMKQMWKIARFVLHHSEMGKIARVLMDNQRRNARTGIADFEAEDLANVEQKSG